MCISLPFHYLENIRELSYDFIKGDSETTVKNRVKYI